MSFLQKYKQGGSGTSPTSAVSGEGAFRRSDGLNTAYDVDDEMDMSLSSDDGDIGRKFARKVKSRLTPSCNTAVPKLGNNETAILTEEGLATHSLTGIRSSRRFATAKELGIIESAGLVGPKAAVSPGGVQTDLAITGRIGGAMYQTEINRPPEIQASALCLDVNIPKSPQARHVEQGHRDSGECASSLDSVNSALAGALDEIRGGSLAVESGQRRELEDSGEIDAKETLGSISPTLDRGTKVFTNLQLDDLPSSRGASVRAVVHSSGPGSTLGNVRLFGDLAAVSGQPTVPVQSSNISTADADGNGNGSTGKRESHLADETSTEDEEDDYGDEEFEELDVLLESNSKDHGTQVLAALSGVRNDDTTANREEAMSQLKVDHATCASSNCGAAKNLSSDDLQHHSRTAPSLLCEPQPTGKVVSDREHEVSQKTRQAWVDPSTSRIRHQQETADAGTSPDIDVGTHTNADSKRQVALKNHVSLNATRPSGVQEAWGDISVSNLRVEDGGSAQDSVTTEGRDDVVVRSRADMPACQYKPQNNGACGRMEAPNVDSVSKRGVILDRSAEVRSPERLPGTDVKIVVRPDSVAAVEYVYDPEKRLDMRSFGTQVLGRRWNYKGELLVLLIAPAYNHSARSRFLQNI